MKKGIVLVAMLLALLMLASGCSLIGFDKELDGKQLVAKVKDTEITKAMWEYQRDYLADYYQQYYQQYGLNIQPTAEDMAAYGESALEMLIEAAVLSDKAKELGFDPLSEEETAEIEESADSMLSFYKMLVRAQYHPGIETVEEEQARIQKLVDEKAAAEAALAEAAAQELAKSEETVEPTEGEEPAEGEEPVEPAEGEESTEGEAPVESAEPVEPAEPLVNPDDIEIPEAVATITDEQLDEMLTIELELLGFSRESLILSDTSEKVQSKLREYAVKDVAISDEETKAEFDKQVASQKESYDAKPTLYASNSTKAYYVPAGYRGVKNLLIGLDSESSSKMSELESTISTANTAVTNAQAQLDELAEQDTSAYGEEDMAAYNASVESLNEQVAENQAAAKTAQAELDALTESAFAAALATAEEVLAKAQAGEDFDELIATYGTDSGMKSEPNKSRGYLVCEGLTQFVTEFQEAAMALENVGDISGLVKTDYGYHILQYAQDIESGEVEYTEEIKTSIHDSLLSSAQDTAYQAAVSQWVTEAKPQTFPKVMK